MKKYYEVIAKCGHVGKHQYHEGNFYIEAQTASEAAKVVRNMGRVKHDHKDAIQQVTTIDFDSYLAGKKKVSQEVYFMCTSIQEQEAVWHLIEDKIRPETNIQLEYRDRHSKYKPLKMKKYGNYNCKNDRKKMNIELNNYQRNIRVA